MVSGVSGTVRRKGQCTNTPRTWCHGRLNGVAMDEQRTGHSTTTPNHSIRARGNSGGKSGGKSNQSGQRQVSSTGTSSSTTAVHRSKAPTHQRTPTTRHQPLHNLGTKLFDVGPHPARGSVPVDFFTGERYEGIGPSGCCKGGTSVGQLRDYDSPWELEIEKPLQRTSI